ncbi:MAG: DUF1572 family protein [Ignavibacteriaceae bacterium]|jgi:Protein of unknown function (DUF1572).|nr:MAG: DUF1572 domain-containing protein [Chlorobiota bacterium]KXK03834.1 MAG: DinB superfamily protein [Chlorobi bacterium OLB4]MBV6398198.1 hypothetical protein [Ignavibacteria bacterium]MCC6885889.1 DUF1572 family protein [Ignavibacteriales bacterium]MCE7953454.1 DUF1572 domain-containing protein [Chlorobi bacterium CHB7]MDL1887390.1 DUF1572 domain-containing protein [Ignavibacteria bacterium CHB1]MEB2330048.1 DUF1572 family protein [Ignavibacteriaceae bacterium]OQY78714.1 MAG: hypothet
MDLAENYLSSSINEFKKLKKLCERALALIKPEDYFFQLDENSNSIAIIIRHLSGNMISRWTDFLVTDGEKLWRNRDEEFEQLFYTDIDDINERWEKGWNVLFSTLNSLKPNDLMRTVKIRNEDHSVIEAINRQLSHYGYHAGQIIYLAKHLAGNNWESLSIEKGKSKEFNDKKMGSNKTG